MIADLRGGLVLAVALLFFLCTLALVALSTVMRPDRWCERSRPAG